METGIYFQESQVRKELRAAEIFISEIIKVTLALCCGWNLAATLRCFTFPAGDDVLHPDSHYPPTLKLDLDFWFKYFSDCLFQHISILPQTLSTNVLPCLLQLKSKDFLKMDNTSVQFNWSCPRFAGWGWELDCEGSAHHLQSSSRSLLILMVNYIKAVEISHIYQF